MAFVIFSIAIFIIAPLLLGYFVNDISSIFPKRMIKKAKRNRAVKKALAMQVNEREIRISGVRPANYKYTPYIYITSDVWANYNALSENVKMSIQDPSDTLFEFERKALTLGRVREDTPRPYSIRCGSMIIETCSANRKYSGGCDICTDLKALNSSYIRLKSEEKALESQIKKSELEMRASEFSSLSHIAKSIAESNDLMINALRATTSDMKNQ